MTTQTITTRLTDKEVRKIINVVQGDSGRSIIVEIKDMSLASSMTATVTCKTAANNIYGPITAQIMDGTKIKFTIPGDWTSTFGDAILTVTISKDSQQVSTFAIGMIVNESAGYSGTPVVESGEIYVYIDGEAVQLAKKSEVDAIERIPAHTSDDNDSVLTITNNTLSWSKDVLGVGEIREKVEEVEESASDFQSSTFDVSESKNILNGHWNEGYMNMNGIVAGVGSYVHTDPIPTNGSTQFIATGNNPNLLTVRLNFPIRFVTAFDENNTVLPTKGLQNAGGSGTVASGVSIINIDASVKYIVLTFGMSVMREDLQVMASFDITATNYEKYGKSYILKEACLPTIYQEDYSMNAVLSRCLNGKTIAIFGDSIMRGTGNDNVGAGDLLATKYNMTSINKAQNGACMGIRADKSERAFHIAYQIEDYNSTSPDIVIFDGATNDMGGITTEPFCELGDMTSVYTEPTSETDFSKGFERACYLLRTKFPNAILIFIRVHNMASRLYDRQKTYGERGLEIAKKWGINTIDLYEKMNTQLNGGTSDYLADYTHPNLLGYNTFYIPALEKWLYENRPSEL